MNLYTKIWLKLAPKGYVGVTEIKLQNYIDAICDLKENNDHCRKDAEWYLSEWKKAEDKLDEAESEVGRFFEENNALRYILDCTMLASRKLRTAELLRLRAQGMTHQEIGKRLGLTTRAVENRLLVLRRAEKNRQP